MSVSEAPLQFEIIDDVAWLTLNRPDAGNAIDLPLARALVDASIRCQTDPSIRCVVLTGAGRLFCAGGDVNEFASVGEQIPAFLSELAGTLHMALARFARMDKPLLVVVNGPAAGAGLSLAICGDVVLAAESSHFTAAYSGLGLTPDGGMSWLLPRLVGMRRAQEIILTNRRIKSAEAAQIGMVTRTVADADLMDEARVTAAQLASAAVKAFGSARALLQQSFSNSFETHLECEARAITAAGATAEAREGVNAYFDKRKPAFKGA